MAAAYALLTWRRNPSAGYGAQPPALRRAAEPHRARQAPHLNRVYADQCGEGRVLHCSTPVRHSLWDILCFLRELVIRGGRPR